VENLMTKIAGLLVLLVRMWGTPADASVLELDQRRGATVAVTLNGQRLLLKVDPGSNGDVTLNPDAAARARLRPSLIPVTGLIGPVKVRGRVAKARMVIGTIPVTAAFTWYGKPVVTGADGIISPGLLPYDEVNLVLGSSSRSSVEKVVPVIFSKDVGLAHLTSIGGKPLGVRFSSRKESSMSTAAAGALIAAAHGGFWLGAATPVLINLGIQRPVRPLGLAQPWQVGPFSIRRFLVRTVDWRGPQSFPPEPSTDAAEIVVTGKARGAGKPFYEVVIGLEYLRACSAVRYRKAGGTLTFSC
jgi:hypothetical protein